MCQNVTDGRRRQMWEIPQITLFSIGKNWFNF